MNILVDMKDRVHKKKGLSMTEKAFKVAENAHKGQMRSSGEAYIEHPKAVAEILTYLHADEQTLAAAILHDTVEDTSLTFNNLKKDFGIEVAKLVEGVTKVGKVEQTLGKHERNMQSIRKMFRAMGHDLRVIFIKLADRLHNMMTIDYVPLEKQQRIARETQEIFCPLADLLGIRIWYQQLDDLAFRTLEPQRYQTIRRKRDVANREQREALDAWMNEMKVFFKEHGFASVRFLLQKKHLHSIVQEIRDEQEMLNQLETYYVVRIVVPDSDACFLALGTLHEFATALPNSIQDFITQPKANGYQALHTTVFSGPGNSIRAVIFTEQMEKMAEFGAALPYQLKEEHRWSTLPSWIEALVSLDHQQKDLNDFLQAVQQEIFRVRHRIYISGYKQKFLDLPARASLLDASLYAGEPWNTKAEKAFLNGKETSLRQSVYDGDIVDFIMSNKAVERRAEDLVYAHTTFGQQTLIELLSALPATKAVSYGKEYFDSVFSVAMDPFFPVAWQKEVSAQVSPSPRQLEDIGHGVLNPFSLLEEKCLASHFFLLNPACFLLANQPQNLHMRFILRTSLENLRSRRIIGVQVQPDVVNIMDSADYGNKREYREELVSLKIANPELLAHPFAFALMWTFMAQINPLETIAGLQELIDTPINLIQVSGNSITLGFHTDKLHTIRAVYEHLRSLPHILNILRISP